MFRVIFACLFSLFLYGCCNKAVNHAKLLPALRPDVEGNSLSACAIVKRNLTVATGKQKQIYINLQKKSCPNQSLDQEVFGDFPSDFCFLKSDIGNPAAADTQCKVFVGGKPSGYCILTVQLWCGLYAKSRDKCGDNSAMPANCCHGDYGSSDQLYCK